MLRLRAAIRCFASSSKPVAASKKHTPKPKSDGAKKKASVEDSKPAGGGGGGGGTMTTVVGDKGRAAAALDANLTCSKDASVHTNDDVGKIYSVDEHGQQLVPEGFGGDLGKILSHADPWKRHDSWLHVLKKTSAAHILVRSESISVINTLKSLKENQSAFAAQKALILDGKCGCGKSMSLNHIVLWARYSNWLVLFIPQASRLLTTGRSFAWTSNFEVAQPEFAQQILTQFERTNEDKLKKISLKSATKQNHFQDCKTLSDVVRVGRSSPDIAMDAILLLKDELALVTEFPVLVAIDEFNLLFGRTEFVDITNPTRPQLHSSRIVLASMLMNWKSETLKNGVIVAANSHSRGAINVDPNIAAAQQAITIPPFSTEEIATMLRVYSTTKHIVSKISDSQIPSLAVRLKTDCNGYGRIVHRIAATL